jgi:hypothetical protein
MEMKKNNAVSLCFVLMSAKRSPGRTLFAGLVTIENLAIFRISNEISFHDK